jgi:hypothetical protein
VALPASGTHVKHEHLCHMPPALSSTLNSAFSVACEWFRITCCHDSGSRLLQLMYQACWAYMYHTHVSQTAATRTLGRLQRSSRAALRPTCRQHPHHLYLAASQPAAAAERRHHLHIDSSRHPSQDMPAGIATYRVHSTTRHPDIPAVAAAPGVLALRPAARPRRLPCMLVSSAAEAAPTSGSTDGVDRSSTKLPVFLPCPHLAAAVDQ